MFICCVGETSIALLIIITKLNESTDVNLNDIVIYWYRNFESFVVLEALIDINKQSVINNNEITNKPISIVVFIKFIYFRNRINNIDEIPSIIFELGTLSFKIEISGMNLPYYPFYQYIDITKDSLLLHNKEEVDTYIIDSMNNEFILKWF